MMVWTCDVCLTENDDLINETTEKRLECEACEKERPGFTKPKSLITGSSNAIQGEGAAILFGASPASTSAPLSFGSATTSDSAPISFGSSTVSETTSVPLFGASTSSSTVPVLFGAKASEKTVEDKGEDKASRSLTPPRGPSATKEEKEDVPRKASACPDTEETRRVNFEMDSQFQQGKCFVWGSGECDQLPFSEDDLGETGIISLRGVDKLNKFSLRDVSCGALHTVVLIDDGRAATFGCNDDGALGREVKSASKERFPAVCRYLDGDKEGDLIENIIAVTAGNSHTAMLKADGTIVVAGAFKASSGSKVSVNGKNSPQDVTLPLKSFSIASGNDHLIALCHDPKNPQDCVVYTMGINEFGQLGRPHGENPSDEDLKATITPEMIEAPSGHRMMDAHAGANGTIIRTKDREGNTHVFSVGVNGTGEVGVSSKNVVIDSFTEIIELRGKDIKDICLTEYSGKALLTDGSVYTWGHPEYSGLGELKEGRKPILKPRLITGLPPLRILAGGARTCFGITRYDSRQVYGWGDTICGQLMEEKEQCQLEPLIIEDLNDKIILRIACGSQHCVAIIQEPDEIPTPVLKRGRAVEAKNDEPDDVKSPALKRSKREPYPARNRRTVLKFGQ